MGLSARPIDGKVGVMTTLFSDTTPEAEAMLLDLYRRAPGPRKLVIVGELVAATKQLMLGGLRERFPHAGEAELRRRLADLLLGPELAEKAYGPLLLEGQENAV
jgi:hypothetical protein